MKSRHLLLLFSVTILCGAGPPTRAWAQDKGEAKAFDAAMSLEETVAWLGKRLTHSSSVAAADGKYVRRVETRLVRAKGCMLSYSRVNELDSGPSVAGFDTPIRHAGSNSVRELWTLDLSGLDAGTIRGGASGDVWFAAVPESRNAIQADVFRGDALSYARNNVGRGHISLRDGVASGEAAAGLRHAVELCRQRKQ